MFAGEVVLLATGVDVYYNPTYATALVLTPSFGTRTGTRRRRRWRMGRERREVRAGRAACRPNTKENERSVNIGLTRRRRRWRMGRERREVRAGREACRPNTKENNERSVSIVGVCLSIYPSVDLYRSPSIYPPVYLLEQVGDAQVGRFGSLLHQRERWGGVRS